MAKTPDVPSLDWTHDFATREHTFRPSPVRAVFETAMRPDVVSLAGGNPDLSFLPHEYISQLTSRALLDGSEDILQYGSGAGTDQARELSAALCSWGGINYSIDEIQMTSGSQAGLDAVTKVLCNPGDVIIAEGPTYVGVLGTFGAYETQVIQLPIDSEGLDPDLVAHTIDETRKAGKKVRFVYTISAYQNPSGVSLSPARHKRLVQECASRGVWVVEDDAYGLLGFNNDQPPTFAGSGLSLPQGSAPLNRNPMVGAVSKEHVIHLGSYSKIFSPGARVGWIGAPKHLRERLQIACESVCITPSVISQQLVTDYVGTDLWRESIIKQTRAYHSRLEAAESGVRQYLPKGCVWDRPEGGFFLWITLPQRNGGWGDILARGLAEKVVIIPGSGCYIDGEQQTHLRIAYSAVEEDTISEGTRRLGQALA